MYQQEHKVTGIIPEGVSGPWTMKRFEVTEKEAEFGLKRSAFRGGRYVPAGEYTGLTRNGSMVMSDTPDEIRDHLGAIRNAKGTVLINGLGLGMVAMACARKPEVERVVVIEKSEDVIALTGPTVTALFPKIEVICADAYTYTPPKGQKYGMVWHDIWDNICGDNLPQMTKLKRKYGRRAAWQGAWAEYQCKRR